MKKTDCRIFLSLVLALFCAQVGATVPGVASELVVKYESLPSAGDSVKYSLPEYPGESLYGRVAAIPGQTVQIIDRRLIVDGKEVQDRIYSLIPKSLSRTAGPLKVPEGYVFIVQGNYRPNTYIGLVEIKKILGKFVVVVRP